MWMRQDGQVRMVRMARTCQDLPGLARMGIVGVLRWTKGDAGVPNGTFGPEVWVVRGETSCVLAWVSG